MCHLVLNSSIKLILFLLVEMLLQKFSEFNIDLNTKDRSGMTAFHWACSWGQKDIVEMMMNYANSFKIDLVAKNWTGKTGFSWAESIGENDIVNLIKRKMPEIAF